MSETRDLLIELGTEELPPKSLRRLSEAFGREICNGLRQAGLEHGDVALYATPRRLAVLVAEVPESQPERELERRGPAVSAAFDADGQPTKAAQGFARACGVEVEHLERLENADGAWLVFRTTEVGQATASLLPGILENALARLPIAKRMRWADLDAEFVRPVHWLVLLFGHEVVHADVLGVSSGRTSLGHRFHQPEPLAIDAPSGYATLLYGSGRVVADFATRREMIRRQVEDTARSLGGSAVIDVELLDEVTSLVEWPAVLSGSFDEEFLELPDAALVATMKGHQRYFHVVGPNGRLLPHFITIANIESSNPDAVRVGNERVLRPRLADAAFFFRSDLQQRLDTRLDTLKDVVFQKKLGSLYDKVQRVSKLAGHVAIALGEVPDQVKLTRRAGLLSKCDLLTQMVGEFPELQGFMGREYAARDGEPEAVAKALEEVYRPRFAGDAIPETSTGRAVSIAEKLDTLVGIFGIGQVPTGDKDPFALRRAALGALRVMIEGELELDLARLLDAAASGYGDRFDAKAVAAQVHEFMQERLRAYFLDQGVTPDTFAAVQAREPNQPFDFARRVHAVSEFRALPEAASLAAANKRIQNILRQNDDELPRRAKDELFCEDAEWNLAAKVVGLGPRVRELLKAGDYAAALRHLATLRDAVDAFFDGVKVMADDAAVRTNRLALLNSIGEMFLETADISRLQLVGDEQAES